MLIVFNSVLNVVVDVLSMIPYVSLSLHLWNCFMALRLMCLSALAERTVNYSSLNPSALYHTLLITDAQHLLNKCLNE